MMKKIKEYQIKDSRTSVVAEPVIAYGSKNEVNVCRNYASRNDMKAAIDGDELFRRQKHKYDRSQKGDKIHPEIIGNPLSGIHRISSVHYIIIHYIIPHNPSPCQRRGAASVPYRYSPGVTPVFFRNRRMKYSTSGYPQMTAICVTV